MTAILLFLFCVKLFAQTTDRSVQGDFDNVVTVTNDGSVAVAGIGALADKDWARVKSLGLHTQTQLDSFEQYSVQFFADKYGWNLSSSSPSVVHLPTGINLFYHNSTLVGMFAKCSSGTYPRPLSDNSTVFGKRVVSNTADKKWNGASHFETELLFALMADFVVDGGTRVGEQLKSGQILFTDMISQFRKDKDWSKPKNRRDFLAASRWPSLIVTNGRGLTNYLITADILTPDPGKFVEVSDSFAYGLAGVTTVGRIVMTF